MAADVTPKVIGLSLLMIATLRGLSRFVQPKIAIGIRPAKMLIDRKATSHSLLRAITMKNELDVFPVTGLRF